MTSPPGEMLHRMRLWSMCGPVETRYLAGAYAGRSPWRWLNTKRVGIRRGQDSAGTTTNSLRQWAMVHPATGNVHAATQSAGPLDYLGCGPGQRYSALLSGTVLKCLPDSSVTRTAGPGDPFESAGMSSDRRTISGVGVQVL